jgi:hypothetical protein
MKTAKNLKSHTTQIKRTVTGIRSIVSYTEAQRRYADITLLSEADRKTLEKAAIILNQVGSKTASMSTKAASQERARELALKKATDEAIKLFNQWPVAVTILDKVALIYGNRGETHLLEDLERDESRKDWAWDLNYWYEEAMREIPRTAAWSAVSGTNPKSVADLMLTAAVRLAEIKSKRTVELVAARWQVKLDQEASGARK